MSTEEFYSHELIDWAKSVEFYLEETAIFEERLETVIKGYSKPDILATIEHFQNVFIAQKEALLGLRSDIARQKERLADDIKHFARFDDLNTVDNQFSLRDSVHRAEKIFLENKHAFYHFLAKVFFKIH